MTEHEINNIIDSCNSLEQDLTIANNKIQLLKTEKVDLSVENASLKSEIRKLNRINAKILANIQTLSENNRILADKIKAI